MTRFRLKSRFADFLRESDGSATIEFVLWLPLLTGIIALSADTALFFAMKAQVVRIVQDANRAASIGRLDGVDATVEFIEDQLGGYAEVADIEVELLDGDSLISTTVSIPTEEITATELLVALSVDTMTVNGQHLLE